MGRGGITLMTKFPYVVEYKLFEKVEVADAKVLLDEYNDFYLYNQSQYYDIFKKAKREVEDDGKELDLALAEKNAKRATRQPRRINRQIQYQLEKIKLRVQRKYGRHLESGQPFDCRK